MTLSRAERADVRRAEILAAAARLFRQRGFGGVGIDDIGAAVGISGPGVYRHFAGKQALLAEIVASVLDRIEQETVAADGGDAADTSAVALLDAVVAGGLQDPDALVVYLRQMGQLEPGRRDELRALRARLTGRLDPLLAAGPDGRPTGSKNLRLRACAGALAGAALTRSVGTRTRQVVAADMVRELVRAPLPASGDDPTPTGPDTRETPTLRHVTRREALLAAATVRFRERGFNGVSLRDIGAEAGITASAVNRHFQSKDQLLAAVFDRAGEQIAGGIAAALARSTDPGEAGREIVRRYARLAVEARDLIATYATETHALPEVHRERRRRSQRMYLDEFAHLQSLARPSASAEECRLRSRAAFSVVNECIIDDALIRRPNLAEELTILASHVVVLWPVNTASCPDS